MAGSMMNQSRAQGTWPGRAQGTGPVGLGSAGSLQAPTGAQTSGGGGIAGNPPLMTAMPQPIIGQGAGAPPGAPQQPMASGMAMRPQAMVGSGMGPSMHQQAQAMEQHRMGNPMGGPQIAPQMGGPQIAPQNMNQLQHRMGNPMGGPQIGPQNMNQLQQMLEMGQRRQAMMNAARGRR